MRGTGPGLAAAILLLTASGTALPDAAPAQPALDAGRVRADTFTYDVLFDGDPLGTLRVSYARTADGGLRVREAVSGTLGDEVTTAVVARDLRPVSAEREGRLARSSTGLDLTYADGRVTGEAAVSSDSAGPGQGPGDTRRITVDRELPPGVLDSNTLVAAVLASPLAAGDTLRYPLFRPGRGVVRARARVAASEGLRVPAGDFETYRVELVTDQGEFVLWVTREPPRALVKQAFLARPVEVELRAVGTDSAAAPTGRDSAAPSRGS